MDEIIDVILVTFGEFLIKMIRKLFGIQLNFYDGGKSILALAFIVLIILLLIVIF